MLNQTVEILPTLPTSPVDTRRATAVENHLNTAGIDRPYLYLKLKEQLEATRGNMEPDYVARDRALEKCLRLLGDLRDAPIVTVDNRKQSVNVTAESLAELKLILAKMSELEQSWKLLAPAGAVHE